MSEELYIPDDWADPNWLDIPRPAVHEWRSHVPEHVQKIWHSFTDIQKRALAAWALEDANDEHWD